MKPPPIGIVWSGRRRTCPVCGRVVNRAWAVEDADGTRTWGCDDCRPAETEPLSGVAMIESVDPPAAPPRPLAGPGQTDHPGRSARGAVADRLTVLEGSKRPLTVVAPPEQDEIWTDDSPSPPLTAPNRPRVLPSPQNTPLGGQNQP